MIQLLVNADASMVVTRSVALRKIRRPQTVEGLLRPSPFFASNGIMDMMRSFEKVHIKQTFKTRNPVRKRMIAIGLTFTLGFLLIASVILIILGGIIIDFMTNLLSITSFANTMLNFFRWLVMIALLYAGISFIYRYGAALRTKFHFFTPGATLATILSLLTSIAFSFYARSYGSYDQVYGPIAGIIILMLWIQLNSFILLVGFELNASIAVNRDLKVKPIDED